MPAAAAPRVMAAGARSSFGLFVGPLNAASGIGLAGTAAAARLALPATPAVLTGFAVPTGATFRATLPPTTQRVARHFGADRLAAPIGVVMPVHRIGRFVGIRAGGWAAAAFGSDTPLWLADIAPAPVAMAPVSPHRARAVMARRIAAGAPAAR
jgi:hypothetical protein